MLSNRSPRFYMWFAMWMLVIIGAALVAGFFWVRPASYIDVIATSGLLVIWAALYESLKASKKPSEASTSSQGSLTRGIDGDPHPKPVVASRIRQLKEDSDLTWDQLRRLFGVSRRAVHMWAGGAQMNSRNEERLAYLEQVVNALGSIASERRDMLLSSQKGGGRSIFQQLVLSASGPQDVDIEALTESTGAGRTVHGDFLFAEVIDGDQEDR